MVYLPIIGSFLEASGNILEKRVLRIHNIEYKSYMVYSFLAIVLVMLPFVFFFWQIDKTAMQLDNLFIFFLIIIISIFANLLTFYSLKRKNLTELEPIALMQPLFTIVLAFIFSFFFATYSSEKNPYVLVLALIASIALIISHIEKHHLDYNKCIIYAVLGSFLFALELVISKFILGYYGSFTFYFLRCLFVFIIAWIIFQPKIMSINKKTKWLIFLSSISWVVFRIILYYSYQVNGIIKTTIMISLITPIFIYFLAIVFLKEKLKLKHLISAIIILACVITALMIGG